MPNSTFGLQTEFVYMLKRKYWIIHDLCQLACFIKYNGTASSIMYMYIASPKDMVFS